MHLASYTNGKGKTFGEQHNCKQAIAKLVKQMLKPFYLAKEIQKQRYTMVVQSVTQRVTVKLKSVNDDAYRSKPFVVSNEVFKLAKKALEKALALEPNQA